ncbi:MAG: UDP-glucose 4-epimerase GalE [Bacteroidetes bacterium]|nr:UDP-glucose 4-epimerase GalE [Bacteroidota bacterium]MBL6944725.1 UDP-glucose 4-epimerase GalE [Bacteroidales bacterium]
MKILVTGGTGYIGSHTVVELQTKGHEVIIVDNLSNSSAEIADKIALITGVKPRLEIFDLTDGNRTSDFFERNNDIAGVIHFAAFKAVGESVQKPLLYYQNNLTSLINILQGMNDNGIQNIVFSSSCTVYGQPDELPVSESAPIKIAESPYGNTKQISEEIIKDTINTSDLHAIALRYFNPIGAHETALIGELPIGVPNNLVPFITQTAIGIRDYLSVFGDTYPTPDGTAIRDYIHVVDLAKAHVIAVDRMLNDKMKTDFEVFNLGTGFGYSVLEVINSFEKVTGLKLNYKIVDRREGDITQVWADPEYSNKELGWKAEKGIDEMNLSAWKWEMAYQESKK